MMVETRFLISPSNRRTVIERAEVGRLFERVRRALRLHGFVGLLKLLPQNVVYLLSPARRRWRRSLDEFDRQFGVDTAGMRSISTLEVPIDVAAHATRYEPIPELNTYLESLAITYSQYSFIDYGCGKGRALLMASDFPFNRIIGIEYSPELATIARRNIRSYRNPAQKCHTIDVVEGNAAAFEPPAGAAVFFLHNPFDEVILEQVLDRVRRSRAERRQDDYLVYVDPRHRRCIDADRTWQLVSDHPGWVAYRRRTVALGRP